MGMPPGRDAVSVPGLDSKVNPKLTRAAGEVAAWVDYLLHPKSNNGPRVYRSRYGKPDSPFPDRNKDMDNKPNEYKTVSILEAFAGDPDAFVRPIQAIAGLRHELIDGTYQKLLQGYFTWKKAENAADPGEHAIPEGNVIRYAELNSARFDWNQMRTGWEGTLANAAYLYEEAIIRYQVVTENCLYVVAQHLTQYWVVFDKAGKDLLELMNAFTEECAAYSPGTESGGLTLDVESVAVSAVIAAVVTVLTAGTGGVTAGALFKTVVSTVLSKTLSEAKAAEKKNLALNKHHHLGDTAKQYLDEISRIEREVIDAVNGLTESLRGKLEQVRDQRRYEIGRDTGKFAETIPHVADFK